MPTTRTNTTRLVNRKYQASMFHPFAINQELEQGIKDYISTGQLTHGYHSVYDLKEQIQSLNKHQLNRLNLTRYYRELVATDYSMFDNINPLVGLFMGICAYCETENLPLSITMGLMMLCSSTVLMDQWLGSREETHLAAQSRRVTELLSDDAQNLNEMSRP